MHRTLPALIRSAAILAIVAAAALVVAFAQGPGDGRAAVVLEIVVRPGWVSAVEWVATAVIFGWLALVNVKVGRWR